MLSEIEKTIEIIENDLSIRALIVTGSGRAFSSGADIPGISVENPELTQNLLEEKINPLILRISNLRVPTVAAVNGVAAGGGLGFALAADFIIASQDAYFLFPFAKLGLTPDAGSSWFLQKAVGSARAKEIAFLGEPLSAQKAYEWGMLYEVVDSGGLLEEANLFAERLSLGPTSTYVMTRELLSKNFSSGLVEAQNLEAEYQKKPASQRTQKRGLPR